MPGGREVHIACSELVAKRTLAVIHMRCIQTHKRTYVHTYVCAHTSAYEFYIKGNRFLRITRIRATKHQPEHCSLRVSLENHLALSVGMYVTATILYHSIIYTYLYKQSMHCTMVIIMYESTCYAII